jgi:hypothetical protein
MDVGGLRFDRARNELVDQANDRRLAGQIFSRSASSCSQSPASACGVASESAAAISGYSRANAASSSIGTAGATARPVAAVTAAGVKRSSGLAIASRNVPSPIASGTARAWRRNFAVSRSVSSGSAG